MSKRYTVGATYGALCDVAAGLNGNGNIDLPDSNFVDGDSDSASIDAFLASGDRNMKAPTALTTCPSRPAILVGDLTSDGVADAV